MHALAGVKLAQKLGLVFNQMSQACMEHHERVDGTGYPRKVSGKQISAFGRLVAVADSFCAMINAAALCPRPMEPKFAARGPWWPTPKRYEVKLARASSRRAYLTGQF